MKICIIFSNIHLGNITAQPKIALQVVKSFKQTKHQVSLISNAPENLKYKFKNKDGLIISGLGDLKTYFQNLYKIVSFIKQKKPDVIHVHGNLLTLFFWIISVILHIPVTCYLCETLSISHSLYNKLLIFSLKRIRQVFVSAKLIKRELVRYGIQPSKITNIHIGLESKFIDTIRHNHIQNDILFYGDSHFDRGFDIVVALAEKLPNLRFQFYLRWQSNQSSLQLEKLKRLPNVTVNITPDKNSMDKIILNSRLVILPFKWMGVRPPLSIIEVMALGRVLITSDMPGNNEVIKNRKNGFMVNFTNQSTVVKLIQRLLDDDKLRKSIEIEAINTIRRLYTPKEYNKILNYYEKI